MYFVSGSAADSVLKQFKVLGDIVPVCISYNQGVKITDKRNQLSDLMSLTECNCGTIQKLPFGVNTVIELKNVTTASDNTGALVW